MRKFQNIAVPDERYEAGTIVKSKRKSRASKLERR